MNKQKIKQNKIARRHVKIRRTISGTAVKPRLNVYRSNTGMYLQIIDDVSSRTLVSAVSTELKDKKLNKTQMSLELGKLLAKKAIEKKILDVVFDRGGYKYHGRVKAAADGAREGGLKF